MKAAPYRHAGGALVCDHGPLTLAGARALAAFYAHEADYWQAKSKSAMSRACARRAQTLTDAADDAVLWRRAAGWSNADLADEP